jgi:hypothetical protein
MIEGTSSARITVASKTIPSGQARCYARERDIDVRLERHDDDDEWLCLLSAAVRGQSARGSGRTAREAIKTALQ